MTKSPFNRRLLTVVLLVVYVMATWLAANASLSIQSLVLVAGVFGILAISLDLVAGMLGLYSLGQGGFFGIGSYVTAIAVADLNVSPFLLLPVVIVVSGLCGVIIGAMSLRVSGLYFAITTFIFTLVLTVMATDMQITGGTQGLLGPAFPDFPTGLAWLGAPVAWCILLALLAAAALVWNIRRSPLYPVLLSIRDAEPFAEAAGVRTSAIKIGIFGLSAAMAGTAGWLFSFLGVVSPGQFDWSVSLNVLVMVLVGGINTTLGPLVGAAFVSMFPAVVDINPWLEEVLYGALSILAITVFPEGVVGLIRRQFGKTVQSPVISEDAGAVAPSAVPPTRATDMAGGDIAVECRGIEFSYAVGPKVLRDVNVVVRRGHIHGLIGPNGSGKSTLANVIAGRLRPVAGAIFVKGQQVNGVSPSGRARLGLRRTFQAAQLVRELTTSQNVSVGLYTKIPGIVRRAAIWPLLPSGQRDLGWMTTQAVAALQSVGATNWTERRIGDVPHGVEQLTQLASVCVAAPDIIILDEPATGLSSGEVDHLARILSQLKAQGVTMIIIEHQTRFLLPLCDRVTVLNAGEVVLTATADEVRAHPIVRQVYLGE
ncbi:ATP-binding cassette domain-containing protein [Acidisoma cellulosilytica]|uniref:ATP-binding cassette domain-containing protein n=1 Tax=Acidisoma cellulosilyticum TaxID=2802395 RepID=A0A963Z5R9_9PROT|nr:ATP-binding cassette domain-containing protein [Acidisoma cellulosilyticum]MCB8882545.1 ATP-binding cassette domain-containing protein [Acidisoma cellulosilyticum]